MGNNLSPVRPSVSTERAVMNHFPKTWNARSLAAAPLLLTSHPPTASSLDPTPPGAPRTPAGCSPSTSEVPFQHLPGVLLGAVTGGGGPLALLAPSSWQSLSVGRARAEPYTTSPPDPETLAAMDREWAQPRTPDPHPPPEPHIRLLEGQVVLGLQGRGQAEGDGVRVRARVLISGALGSRRRQVLSLRLREALWALPQPPFVPLQPRVPGSLAQSPPTPASASWQGTCHFHPRLIKLQGPTRPVGAEGRPAAGATGGGLWPHRQPAPPYECTFPLLQGLP